MSAQRWPISFGQRFPNSGPSRSSRRKTALGVLRDAVADPCKHHGLKLTENRSLNFTHLLSPNDFGLKFQRNVTPTQCLELAAHWKRRIKRITWITQWMQNAGSDLFVEFIIKTESPNCVFFGFLIKSLMRTAHSLSYSRSIARVYTLRIKRLPNYRAHLFQWRFFIGDSSVCLSNLQAYRKLAALWSSVDGECRLAGNSG